MSTPAIKFDPGKNPGPCVFCGGGVRRKSWVREGYNFVKCADCGVMYIDPIPTPADLTKAYEEDFFKGGDLGYENYEQEMRWRRMNYKRDAEHLEKHVQPGRLLDVGCATGHFLDALSDHWEKHGLEVSEFAGKQAREKYGDRITIASLRDAKYQPESFDTVTLYETLNHLPDPEGDLQIMRGVLKKGGMLVITVGDADCLLSKVSGRFWYQLTPPIHIYHFSKKSLPRLLNKVGFDVMRVDYLGKYTDFSGCLRRLRDMSSAPAWVRFCKTLSAGPWSRWLVYLNLFDTMFVYAKKR